MLLSAEFLPDNEGEKLLTVHHTHALTRAHTRAHFNEESQSHNYLLIEVHPHRLNCVDSPLSQIRN